MSRRLCRWSLIALLAAQLSGSPSAAAESLHTADIALNDLNPHAALLLLRSVADITNSEVVGDQTIQVRDTLERLVLAEKVLEMVDSPQGPPDGLLTHEAGEQFLIAVIPLHHASASDVMAAFRDLKISRIAPVGDPPVIVIRDNPEQVHAAIALVETMDQPEAD